MVTIYEIAGQRNGRTLDLMGKSGDTKPIDTFEGYPILNGSTYTEEDTGKTYMYDEEGKIWY